MEVKSFPMPRNLVERAGKREEGEHQRWTLKLPGIVEGLEHRWSLRLGEPYQPGGQTAWVAPARTVASDDLRWDTMRGLPATRADSTR